MCALNVLTIANKTGSMIAKSLPKVADAGQNLSKGLEKTSSNVDSINCAINKLTTTIDEAKDKFIVIFGHINFGYFGRILSYAFFVNG